MYDSSCPRPNPGMGFLVTVSPPPSISLGLSSVCQDLSPTPSASIGIRHFNDFTPQFFSREQVGHSCII